MSLATRNQVWDALPPVRFGEERPLDLDLDETTERHLAARLFSRDFDDWSRVLSRVGFCSNPDPAGRPLGDLRQHHRGAGPLIRLGARGAGRDVHAVRQPPR